MYKVLIADDEALETEALRRIIQATYGEKCQVVTASNGKMAISLAEEFRPDIALMDIEMPGVNGLEASKVIREMLPRCRIIIVTAYERFQYAQVAISLGAEDYLLKPMGNADLIRLMDSVMANIDKDRADAERHAALDQLAREQFVLSVISGYSSIASLQRQLQELDIAFGAGLVCAAKSPSGMSAEAVGECLEPFLDRLSGVHVLTYEYDDVLLAALILDGDGRGADTLESQVAGIFTEMYGETDAAVFAGIGAVVQDLGELQRSYNIAMDMLSLASGEEPVKLPRPELARPVRHKGLERKIYGYLLDKDFDAALRCVDMMFDTLFCALDQPEAVLEVARDVLLRVAKKLQQDARLPDDLTLNVARLGDGAATQAEMMLAVRGLLGEWMGALDVPAGARMLRIRAEIERYLQEHYAEDLSIKRVAQEMHYSEPYFSKLFSRCFHKNFVTFLTDIRMQAARDMLSNSMANVRDVSAAVGFADANYFAKVFRKAYGISPTEYRRHVFVPDTGSILRQEGGQNA